MVSEEAQIVTHRINAQMASQTALFQMALSSVVRMGVDVRSTKKAAKDLNARLKDMINGAE